MSRSWQTFAAYLVSAVCLVWVLRDVDPARLVRETRGMAWDWVALSAVANILSYVAQGWRWQRLLRPCCRASIAATTRAIYAGLFVNEVLPLRTGEIVRAYLISRRLSVPVSGVVPSIVVERLLDGLLLAVAVAAAAFLLPLPGYMVKAGDVLGAGTAILIGAAILAIVRAGRRHGVPPPKRRLARLFDMLARDLHAIGTSGVLLEAAFGSVLLLVGQMLAFWLVMWAFGIRVPFWQGAVVLVIMHLGTLVPSAPANAGPFQFFTVAGLTLFGVDRHEAAAFSLVVFFLLTAPLLVLGFFALSQSGMTLTETRRQVRPPKVRGAPGG